MSEGKVVLLRSPEGRKLVQRKCKAAGLDISVLEQLVAAEVEQQGKLRKRGITDVFNEIFDEIDAEDA